MFQSRSFSDYKLDELQQDNDLDIDNDMCKGMDMDMGLDIDTVFPIWASPI